MFGFFYVWESHIATVTGSTKRHVRCFNCDTPFEYQVTRTARGGGHSPLHLNPHGAAQDAKRRAYINLDRALRDTVEPVYCPTCGVFQPEMVQQLRNRFGNTFDPNKYATERIEIPFRSAWHKVVTEDSTEAYTHFIEVWPTATQSVYAARERIKYLTRSPLVAFLNKIFPLFAKITWLLIVILFLSLMYTTIMYH